MIYANYEEKLNINHFLELKGETKKEQSIYKLREAT